MIILPERGVERPRFLPPIPRASWRSPSQAVRKDQIGNDVYRVRFRVRALVRERIVWTGWFASRDDFDAFLDALARGALASERPLWSLPAPAWHPDLVGPGVLYDFATSIIITGTGAGTFSFAAHPDWNNSQNIIECLGGGASGGTAANNNSARAAGGGGGSWGVKAAYSNLSSGDYSVGIGGTGASASSGTAAGNSGGDTWFGNSVLASAAVSGLHGSAGAAATNNSPVSGGAGGIVGVGDSTAAGGRGGNIAAGGNGTTGTTGGGGAAGPGVATVSPSAPPTGSAGGNGGDITTAGSLTVSAGGNGDGGFGGAGSSGATSTTGAATSSKGGNGSEDGTAGSGGGSGGANTSGGGHNSTSGAGGNYGAGSGGAAGTGGGGATQASGAGLQGYIALWYVPFIPFVDDDYSSTFRSIRARRNVRVIPN